ncbi:MAG: ABC transporter ATP-binding protein [Candidatus Omnitrophica bacterium]|nr:ABC transporter ATP-binding protein [Candidatus Omnitrophota bacterium]MDD5736727.1 ABC transporter ATP-binding protein [Candidatus Omnitrophota bacterium]
MKTVEFENVGKRFHKSEYYFSRRDYLWALKDVSFSVGRGESVGITGPNGSGKTTLMRLIAGITEPTSGKVTVNGRVVPLIRVEGALNFNLSVRENIYLLSAVFGIRKKGAKKIFDDIVDFAGIRDMVDVQILKLSHGMISRVSFSIAAHIDGDILLIDEVLAVGDTGFQEQCFRKLAEIKYSGKTVFFVSNDVDSIRRICGRTIVMEGGSIVSDGA